LRTYQLLGKFSKLVIKGEKEIPGEWLGMEMFLGKQIRAADPPLQIVYNNFRKNLEDVVNVARKHHTNVILSTVGVNLKDSAPFASLHRRDITSNEKDEWENLYRSGIQFESAGEYSKAVRLYLNAARIDSRFADLQHRLGKSYWALGNYKEARDRYIMALSLDTLRFRADSQVNNIIRSVSESGSGEGIYFVDAIRAFEEESQYKTPGDGLFYDHVHMNFKGNYILAKTVFSQIANILPEQVRRAKADRPLLTEEECAEHLAFTGYDRYKVTAEVLKRFNNPPFTNQLNHTKQVRQIQQKLDSLKTHTYLDGLKEADTEYQQAIQKAVSDPWLYFNYAVLLKDVQNHQETANQLRMSLRYLPQNAAAREMLAAALIHQGEFEEAVSHCNEAIRVNPDFYKARYTMAFALARQGKFDRSIEEYKRLLRVDPIMSADIYNEIGRILIKQDKLQEAVKEFRKAIRYNDESGSEKNIPDVHFNLGHTLKKLGRTEEANNELNKAKQGYRKKN
jgi:tetratricopeptide (TPR) repeat protein